LAVYDLSKIASVATTATKMATALTEMSSAKWNTLCNSVEWFCSDDHDYYPHADLYDLAVNALLLDSANASVYKAVKTAVDAAVLYEDHGIAHSKSHGLAIYFPCDVTMDSNYNSTQIEWAADTQWDEMLRSR